MSTHGMSKTKFYEVWHHMKQRCNGTTNKKANKRYYERGISYDKRWRNFDEFYNDMFSEYKDGLQLDRIDNNGDYTKANCRWVTPKENSRNKENTIFINIDGRSVSLAEEAERRGMDYRTIIKRYSKYKIRDVETLFYDGNIWKKKCKENPIIPCIVCGTIGGTLNPSGRPKRKCGMCNTCYQRLVTNAKKRKKRLALAEDMRRADA